MGKRRNGRTRPVTFRQLEELKVGRGIRDGSVPGLQWRRVRSGKGSHVYARLRYSLGGERRELELGRLPTEQEWIAQHVPAMRATGRLPREGEELDAVQQAEQRIDEALAPIREAARNARTLIERGIDPKAQRGLEGLRSGMTLRVARELHFKRMRAKGRAESSFNDYAALSDRHLSDWLDMPLKEITRTMCRERHEEITERSGATTANQTMRVFQSCWNAAAREDETLPACPTIAVNWHEAQRRDSAIPPDKLPQWFREVAAMTDELRRDFYLLAVMTGARKASLLEVRREDVDLERATLHFAKAKGGEKRKYTIPLSDAALAVVRRRLAASNSPWLFPSRQNPNRHLGDPRPRSDDGFTGPYRPDNGTVPFEVHALRATYITVAREAGIDDYHAKLLVNHAVKDVHGGYLSRAPETLRASQQRVTDHLRGYGLPVPVRQGGELEPAEGS